MYGFIKGRVSTCEDMRDPKTAKWIARQLAKWHKVRLPQDQVKKGPLKQKLWPTMRSWLQEGRVLSADVRLIYTMIRGFILFFKFPISTMIQ